MKKVSKNIKIEVLTGLHIGMGGDKAQIGGIDNPFIKDPVSNLPYIPGSSLKGKLRCLLETEGGYSENNEVINRIFGPTSDFLKKNPKYEETPTRLIIRDLHLSKDDTEKFSKGDIQTEIKTEIKIDRKTGKASPGALRTTERIPPQTVFEGTLLIRYTDDKELDEISKCLNSALKLLNNDFLGGSGSRGYGAVNVTLS